MGYALRLEIALSRTFNVGEMQRVEFRAEAFDVTNSFRPGNPVANLFSNTFGVIRTALPPQLKQFVLKYVFLNSGGARLIQSHDLQCRRESTAPGRGLLGARILDILVIFADRFPDLFTWSQRPDHMKLPSFGECTWIFDGDIDIQVG